MGRRLSRVRPARHPAVAIIRDGVSCQFCCFFVKMSSSCSRAGHVQKIKRWRRAEKVRHLGAGRATIWEAFEMSRGSCDFTPNHHLLFDFHVAHRKQHDRPTIPSRLHSIKRFSYALSRTTWYVSWLFHCPTLSIRYPILACLLSEMTYTDMKL